MPLGRVRAPFSHSDWVYEIKWDGFRALAYVEDGVCRLVSRNGNVFKSFPALASGLPDKLRAGAAVLDGEIVCSPRSRVSHTVLGVGTHAVGSSLSPSTVATAR